MDSKVLQDEHKYRERITGNKDWKDVVALVNDLPPMPAVAARAVQLVESPAVTAKKLTEVLSNDAALTARILKIANSAMFARQREITTLTQAIMTIGFKSLKGIIVAAAVRQINKNSHTHSKLIWENSVACAIGATMIAMTLQKKYREEIYILGLLHSLGQIVLLNAPKTSAEYTQIFTDIEEMHVTYVEAEQSVFGYAHPLIGALVAKKWNFSESTCDIILNYKDSIECNVPANEVAEKTAVVNLADCLTHRVGIGSLEGYPNDIDAAIDLAMHIGLGNNRKNALERIEELGENLKERFESESQYYN